MNTKSKMIDLRAGVTNSELEAMITDTVLS